MRISNSFKQKSMIKNTRLFLLLSIALFGLNACDESKKTEETKPSTEKKIPASFEEALEREITAKLEIAATEKWTYEVYEAHLNADDKIDRIIAVNRLDFAMEKAAESKNPAKMAEMDYMGNHNILFYYDGAMEKFSFPIPIPSSPKGKLDVHFMNLTTNAYQDLVVDFRIRNSKFRNYYQIGNGTMALVFQWKIFDNVGTDSPEVYDFDYQPGSYTLAKDIVVYKGSIKNYSKTIPNYYEYNPEIIKDKMPFLRFFFDPKQQKYATNTRPEEVR